MQRGLLGQARLVTDHTFSRVLDSLAPPDSPSPSPFPFSFHQRRISIEREHRQTQFNRSIILENVSSSLNALPFQMQLSIVLRRLRRLASIFTSLHNQLTQSTVPKKHIKIDDEERFLNDEQSLKYHRRRMSPAFQMIKMILLVLLILLVLAALLAYTIYKPPKFVIDYLQRRYPDVIFEIDLPSSQRVVALTLDDAPSAETGRILDLLKTYNAKASFFVIGGQITSHTGLLERMHNEGHEIGNHAWADEPSVKLPLTELERQIQEVESLIPSNPNGAKYFRPGSGFFNSKLVKMVKGLGYRVVLGGIYPHDPQIHNPERNANHVLSMVRPGGIIIMHDRRSYSADQLELVLQGLTKKGWKIESLGGLLRIAEDYKKTRLQ